MFYVRNVKNVNVLKYLAFIYGRPRTTGRLSDFNREFGKYNGTVEEDVLINNSIFYSKTKATTNYIPLNILVRRSCYVHHLRLMDTLTASAACCEFVI